MRLHEISPRRSRSIVALRLTLRTSRHLKTAPCRVMAGGRHGGREMVVSPVSNPNDIAIVGMAAHLPGAGSIEAFWSNLRDGVELIRALSEEELLAAGESPDRLRHRNYVRLGGRARRLRDVRRRVLRLQPERRGDHGSPAPPVPRGRLGGARERRPPARALRRRDRRLRRLRHGQLFLFQHLLEPGPGREHRDVPAAAHRQRQGLPGDARQPRVRPEGPERQHPDRLLDLARRHPLRLPEPC